MPYVGRKFGRYRIEEEIGVGGMGVVYRAYDEKLERDLAIKVLIPGALNDAAARKRFRNEARILSRLNHPSIQTIHDFETVEGHGLLISELVPGVSLDARLRSGALPENEVTRLGYQLAQGLAAAHAAGVLHRDLKPANLRVTTDGRLKILDFGLAKLSREAVLTLSTTLTIADAPTGIAGTLPYMSPEQLMGEEGDQRSDIYSTGVTLFELATQRLPFTDSLVPKLTNAILHQAPPALRPLVPKLSLEFERIVLKCLEKNPELRYQSAKELATDLRRLEGMSTFTTISAAQPWPPRRWLRPAIATVGVIALIVTTWLLWPRFSRSEGTTPALQWEQLTNFNDAAEIPALSRDGKLVAFLRGPGSFGSSANAGQIWFRSLPDGEPFQLTKTPLRKQTINFSQDGSRLFFTQLEGQFVWNTYELPLLGGQAPKLFMANATGLSWIDSDHVLFSAITTGIHMELITSKPNRTEERNIYVPADSLQGMVHRSALSPDGKNVLLAEMDAEWWRRCRVVPFDGSSVGRPVGPEGSCTWAQWSPDGKWMYFTVDTRTDGFHIWRRRFPDGTPQQLTPSGASEEEGLAMMPDGKSFITTSGTQQSVIWLQDDKAGEKQITSEGYSFLPTLSPDGKKVYYLQRTRNAHTYFSGELWVSDVTTGVAERLFRGLVLTHFSISQDGKKVVFATEQGQVRSGIWIGWLDRTQAPRQLTFGGEGRAFFGRPGQILYQGTQIPPKIMTISEDGRGPGVVSDLPIMQLQSVSPDAHWALVATTPPNGHGDRNSVTMAVRLEGGAPITVCDNCSVGFGSARSSAPLLSWSLDGKWVYVSLRPFPFGSLKTAVIPLKSGTAPPAFTKGFGSEADFARIPGSRLINQDDIPTGMSPNYFVSTRRSVKANLFRIYLLK
ncbi:MAG TPA: protein kinase [Candidatus Acidoferrales bacterium]|nr:protein kinase [Candidatus Acidoferrales bacterium]